VFTSRPSLWTNLDIRNEDKARVYLERSKSSPVNLSLERRNEIYPDDPFFRFIPQVIGRLGYLLVQGTPENVQNITALLSHPAPLLKHLEISADYPPALRLTSALFDGDLSSLDVLHLSFVRTELPWRNMVNLTSFVLGGVPSGGVSVIELLDFIESAPRLRWVYLYSVQPTPGAQSGRLVSLTCLKIMTISDCGPPSALLDHLLIPVGTELALRADVISSVVGDLIPRSLDNLRNLSDFTTVRLCLDNSFLGMIFSGPNGRVSLDPTGSFAHKTSSMLESLAQLDTSKTERFRIGNSRPLSRDLVHRALLPMNNLRVFVLCECSSPHTPIRALHPSTRSSEVLVCPNLEELVLHNSGEEAFNMDDVIGMAEARASRGRKLRVVGVVGGVNEPDPKDVLELGKHVGRVEYNVRPGVIGDDW